MWFDSFESTAAALDIIDLVLTRVADDAFEKYLITRQNKFIVDRTLQNLSGLVEWQVPTLDGNAHRPQHQLFELAQACQGLSVIEPSPAPAPLDSWARGSVQQKASLRETVPIPKETGGRFSATQSTQRLRRIPRRTTPIPVTASARTSEHHAKLSAILASEARNRSSRKEVDVEHTKVLEKIASKSRENALAERRDREKEAQKKQMREHYARILQGKTFTVDENGGILVVDPPTRLSLPPSTLKVEAAFEDSEEEPDAETVYTGGKYGIIDDDHSLLESPSGKRKSKKGVTKIDGKTGLNNPLSTLRINDPTAITRSPVRTLRTVLETARGDSNLYEADSMQLQPSLVNTMQEKGGSLVLSPGVRIFEGRNRLESSIMPGTRELPVHFRTVSSISSQSVSSGDPRMRENHPQGYIPTGIREIHPNETGIVNTRAGGHAQQAARQLRAASAQNAPYPSENVFNGLGTLKSNNTEDLLDGLYKNVMDKKKHSNV